RPGQYFDITETDKGTYILNADDLCMAEHIGDMIKAGIYSFKIEGRAKSYYYTAVTANAYRGAIDSYLKNPEAPIPGWVTDELNKISHRTYSTGFYYGRPENAQTYENAGYQRDYSVAGIVTGYANGMIELELKNKFLKGQQLDCLEPRSLPFIIKADEMYDSNDQPIESAPHPTMTVKLPFERPVKVGSLLRMKAQ
ncbi:MAG: U32 family peptidase C-terminal domain-containing protein, partial [Clostridia bacterium]|nr:U32 family peptidase C-terminal domain-containing protein [Clostridia bacterium]